VLWGDRRVLEGVPVVPPERLLRWDALTLLFNRMIEHLDARRKMPTASPEELMTIQYKNGKMLLDLAGSLMAFCGRYAPSYAARAEQFPSLYATLEPLHEQLPELPAWVARWTAFKLHATEDALWEQEQQPAAATRRQWFQTARAAREVWLWQSNRFLGGPPTDDPFTMASKYLKNDMIGMKLKAWVHLVFAARSRGRVGLGRALRLMSLARPNVLIYVAGTVLYFALSIGQGSEMAERVEDVASAANRFLPVPAEHWDDPSEVVAAVVSNWEQFVK